MPEEEHAYASHIASNCVIKTHGSVSCGPGQAADKCVIYR